MKGLKEVFTFTLTQQLKIRSSRILTVVVALILFIVPVIALLASESGKEPAAQADTEEVVSDDTEETEPSLEPIEASAFSRIFWVNETGITMSDEAVTALISPSTVGASVEKSASLSEALTSQKASSESGEQTLVIHFTESDNSVTIRSLLTPEAMNDPIAYNNARTLTTVLQYSLAETVKTSVRSDDPESKLLSKPLSLTVLTPQSDMSEEEQANEETRSILTMLLPYVNIMLIYFLVLYYGQSAANSVILEKTSKLMDTFLVSVKPKSMIFGKVLAIWVAALLQFFIWVIALIAGFAVGLSMLRSRFPGEDLGIFRLFALLKNMTSIFSAPAILEAVLLILCGFLMYCCIAAICASFASKPEELSSTIALFSLSLVVSMLVCLRVGFFNGEMAMGAKWFDFVPFTAILITPSRILLGYVSLGAGLISLLIVLVLSVVFILFSGRAYQMMSLYKGKVPNIKEILQMLKTE